MKSRVEIKGAKKGHSGATMTYWNVGIAEKELAAGGMDGYQQCCQQGAVIMAVIEPQYRIWKTRQ
jgi:hypothetical protein